LAKELQAKQQVLWSVIMIFAIHNFFIFVARGEKFVLFRKVAFRQFKILFYLGKLPLGNLKFCSV
jgi:hypothetical protein